MYNSKVSLARTLQFPASTADHYANGLALNGPMYKNSIAAESLNLHFWLVDSGSIIILVS